MDRDQLAEEVEQWVREDIITESQAEEILARYESGDERSRAVLALSIVGTALVFVGVTLFLATNWSDLPRAARALVLLAGPGLAYAGGVAATRRGADSIGHALTVLGAVLVGPSLFLFADLLDVDVASAWLLLVWSAVALPTGHAIDSRPGTALGLLVVVVTVGELPSVTEPLPVVALLGVVLFALGQGRDGAVPWTYRMGGVAVTLAGLVALTTAEWRFARFTIEATAPLAAGVLGALAGTGALALRGHREESGWAAVSLVALGASTAAATLAPEALPELPAFVVLHLAALAALLATGYLGYRTTSKTLVDLATLGALAQTLSFVASTVIGTLSGAVALVVAGLALLGAGVAIERGRRSVLAQLRE